jgi:hypothetical protein
MTWRAVRGVTTSVALLLLTGCGGDRMTTGGTMATPTGPAAGAAPVDMAGRWMLSAAAGGACGMGLTGSAGASEGTIRPEGGCPGSFFTSRKWTFEGGALVIRNHNNEPLAQLTMVSAARFDGQSTGGQQVSLAR